MDFKKWLETKIGEKHIDYSNDKPYNSYDRWFAVYLIEKNSDILKINAFEKLKEGERNFLQFLSEDELAMFEDETHYAYDNYEREWISKDEALYHLLKVANQGLEAVMADSYDEGGWFGAS